MVVIFYFTYLNMQLECNVYVFYGWRHPCPKSASLDKESFCINASMQINAHFLQCFRSVWQLVHISRGTASRFLLFLFVCVHVIIQPYVCIALCTQRECWRLGNWTWWYFAWLLVSTLEVVMLMRENFRATIMNYLLFHSYFCVKIKVLLKKIYWAIIG
jgi:hypothetical protein